ncbi:inactive ubiquitin carboxyl-terminal hydrolase MINDY-4B isoform X3 [Nilaparvata lugens]|uniref:inactive ubiquitin carboxyl-terminal hydrolase MINDY-4B isoform X3 n=1 Tax=Nilaparvata lugens TaxID=108931 RepID=UPI00193D7433|nr:inactive ubiquitin carboxyl-terminal hydrolase MINDY-4B isoform X3 [Nilaparvata lugens]XP_039296067.1 inactive ubiquitin carboxyl-terminal hydrolase MINDY-4B isoform X3 [Nilaparvata lugens]
MFKSRSVDVGNDDESKKPAELFRSMSKDQLLEFRQKNDRVMYARNQQRALTKTAVAGGTPITEELACELRQVVFGTAVAPPRGEWLRTSVLFNAPEKETAFGLKTPKNGTRGLVAVLQAFVIKHLLFEKKDCTDPPEELLKPNRMRQLDAITMAMAEILWKIAEQTTVSQNKTEVSEKPIVSMVLPQENTYIQHSINYFQDGLTERLHVFEFTEYDELQIFIKRYLYLFLDESCPGCLLFLYSAVATRGTARVERDLDGIKGYMVTAAEEGSECIITLLLCGRATPYLHNGVVYVGDEEHYAVPQWGMLSRNEIGFLYFEEKLDDQSKVPGSRLKTPALPIWVIFCNGHYAVVFNTNRELLRNYHAERRFDLVYYSPGGSTCTLTVDTSQDDDGKLELNEEDTSSTSANNVEKLIHTKWQDAQITWHGQIAFT